MLFCAGPSPLRDPNAGLSFAQDAPPRTSGGHDAAGRGRRLSGKRCRELLRRRNDRDKWRPRLLRLESEGLTARRASSNEPFIHQVCLADFNRGIGTEEPSGYMFRGDIDLPGLSQCAFPDRRDAPSSLHELGLCSPVPGDVHFELGLPELRPCAWRGGKSASIVSMPEAAVDEDRRAELRKQEIRFPGISLHMQSVTKASSVKSPAQGHLWLRVPLAD